MDGTAGYGRAEAFGAPGMPSRRTSSNKEAVGTAYRASSRVWFTCAHGILNKVYYPTMDRPQVRDLQSLDTDGRTFFHEKRRDLNSRDPDSGVLVIRNRVPVRFTSHRGDMGNCEGRNYPVGVV